MLTWQLNENLVWSAIKPDDCPRFLALRSKRNRNLFHYLPAASNRNIQPAYIRLSVANMPRVHIVPTMDVVPPGRITGPEAVVQPDWKATVEAVFAFHNACAARKLNPSFFLHPEVVQALPEAFWTLKAAGAELAILYPDQWSAGKGRKEKYKKFANLTNDEILSLLKDQIDAFERAFGSRPYFLRLSASKILPHQHHTLLGLGLTCGSVSTSHFIVPRKSYSPTPEMVSRAAISGQQIVLKVRSFSTLTPTKEWDDEGLTPNAIASEINSIIQTQESVDCMLVSSFHSNKAHHNKITDNDWGFDKLLNAQIEACCINGDNYYGTIISRCYNGFEFLTV